MRHPTRRYRTSLFAVFFALMDLLVSSEIRDNREASTTAVLFTRKWFLASVTIGVGLQGAWSRETLVTNLALMLLLRAGGDFRAEGRHHLVWDGRSIVEIAVRSRRSDNSGTLLGIASTV